MTGEQDGTAGDRDDVGSLGEEAAKLLGALSDWARDQPEPQAAGTGGAAPGIADRLAEALRQVDQHVATGAAECRYCPVCRVVHAVRQTSPEVREHLLAAAGSLLEAASGLLATQVPRDRGAGSPGATPDRVERIDLDADPGDDRDTDRATDGDTDRATDRPGDEDER